jgi:spore coat protein CotH
VGPQTPQTPSGGGAAAIPSSDGAGGPSAGAPSNLPAEEPELFFDVNALPNSVPQVSIEIGQAERDSLEANPWLAEDVFGTFIDANGTRYESIEVNYRGAYQLINLMMMGDGSRRNWKVKVTDELKYLGHREWNFNSEPHLRHKLAYDLMAFAGVAGPSANHVELRVNGESQGLYLPFEDPDNKRWLKDHFGSAAGDLF